MIGCWFWRVTQVVRFTSLSQETLVRGGNLLSVASALHNWTAADVGILLASDWFFPGTVVLVE